MHCHHCKQHFEVPDPNCNGPLYCPHCGGFCWYCKPGFWPRNNQQQWIAVGLGILIVLSLGGQADAALHILVAGLYVLPTLLARRARHRNLLALGLLNLLLGWTLVGWVAALVWAVYVEKPKDR